MRIIAGAKRGMRLFSPKTRDSRPITDRVKQSLFDVLCNYGLPDSARAADLFCGVGSLGLEALSRGAEFVTFVEQDPKIIAVLERNIEKASFVEQSSVMKANAFRIGPGGEKKVENRKLKIVNWKYALVFVDPPYAFTQDVQAGSPVDRLLALLQKQVTPDAIVVVRTNRRTFLLERYGAFGLLERREWGTMAVTLLQMMGR
jgi:16S rRNA (guanine(966)-N(2))-methyltransferase RsmD